MTVISTYTNSETSTRHQQLAFLRVLAQSPLFITLSCPSPESKISEIFSEPSDQKGSNFASELNSDLAKILRLNSATPTLIEKMLLHYVSRHFLVGVFLTVIRECFATGAPKLMVLVCSNRVSIYLRC